mgnify:CR=1 FL=1
MAAVPGGHRLHFLFAADGAPLELWALRYGELDGSFREERFGARLEAELRFQGIRIPCRLSVGWYFGMDRYEREGEFFRAVIDEAIFR